MALGVITSFSVQQRITLKRAFMWSAVTMMYTSYIVYIVQLTKASHWYRNIFMRYTMSVFNPYKVRGEKHTSSAFQFENDEDQLTSLWRLCQTGFTVWCSLFSICLFCKKDICNTERNNTLFSLILSNRFFLWCKGVTIATEICFIWESWKEPGQINLCGDLSVYSVSGEKANFHSNQDYIKFFIPFYINHFTLSFAVLMSFKFPKLHLLVHLHCFVPLD